MTKSILFWRRLDLDGLERLELDVAPDGVEARSSLITTEAGGFRLDYRWVLGADWRTQTLVVEHWDRAGQRRLMLERAGEGWRVDGSSRSDLDGAEEPDLSVTPFCNTLPIRRLAVAPDARLSLDTAFIDGATLGVTRSLQRYERRGPDRLRYIDLGASSGFEADLIVDDQGLILHYEYLFDRITT